MREKVWINRIRIAVGLCLAVGIFVNNRELTPGWIAFLLALIGLGELAAAPGIKGKSNDDDVDEDQDLVQRPDQEEGNPPRVSDSKPGDRGGFKSLRLSI